MAGTRRFGSAGVGGEQPGEGATIVLLGAMLAADGRPGPAMLRRVGHAAALHAAGGVRAIIVTGGPAGAEPTEARVMRDLLIAAGVPADVVIEEGRARNTLENALFSVAILQPDGPVVVVSDRYHLPRALMLFRLMGRPATGSGPPPGPTASPRDRLASFRREAVAVPRDFVRGLIAARLRGR